MCKPYISKSVMTSPSSPTSHVTTNPSKQSTLSCPLPALCAPFPSICVVPRPLNMKRAADDLPADDQQQRKRAGPMPSNPPITANDTLRRDSFPPFTPIPPFSPAYASPSPQHQQAHTGTIDLKGCSKFEDYGLEDKLGEGTFGEVHKARRKLHKGQFALKRILMHNEKDGTEANFRALLLLSQVPITALREIKILKQLKHPNIVELSDIAIRRGQPAHVDKVTGERKERVCGAIYMVFPYMDHDLAGLLENPVVPRFKVPQVKLYLKQLLEGTYYLHKFMYNHTVRFTAYFSLIFVSITAANLLINNEGILKIADFGLARGFEEAGKEYTNCVVTRWYRPPELLLGERKYTTAIDMWGVGCVFAEMLTGKPILPGQTDPDQLKLIFELVGTPTDQNMPGWRKLPDADKYDPYKGTGPRHSCIADKFGKWGTQTVDLLEKLLALDPEKRISAFEALDHDYFWTEPLPAEPMEIPTYQSSHEYDKRKQRERQPNNLPGGSHPQNPRGDGLGGNGPSGNAHSTQHGGRGRGHNGGGGGGGGRGGRGGDHYNGDSYRPGDRRDHRDGHRRDGHREDGHREGDRDQRYGEKDRDRDRSMEPRDRERGERASSQGAMSTLSASSAQAGKIERQVHALPPKPATIMAPALPPSQLSEGSQGRRKFDLDWETYILTYLATYSFIEWFQTFLVISAPWRIGINFIFVTGFRHTTHTPTMPANLLLIIANKVVLSPETPASPRVILVDKDTGKVLQIKKDRNEISTIEGDLELLALDDDVVVMPGVVDAHVHLNEPGRTEWEGFETGTKAAAAGGVTTVIDMPLNAIPPTTTVANFDLKLEAAKGQCYVDVGFWGGVIPGNQDDLRPLIDKGVRGFKCFLIESGVDEFPCVSEDDVKLAMERLQDTSSVLLFHAEMDTPTSHPPPSTNPPDAYSTFLASRPQSLEITAIDLVIRLTRALHCSGRPVRTHIVHLSAASALPAIRAAKADGLPITVETCHHYLSFDAEGIPNGATHFKCCPPIREESNRQELWAALREGLIDQVVSDHSPCVAELKRMGVDGDFMKAWGGISGVQFGLAAVWTEGRGKGIRHLSFSFTPSLSYQDLTRWLSYNPAKLVNLLDRKGEIKVGADADFVLWKPESQFTVTRESLLFKNKLTPYEGRKLYGMIERTIVRGRTVYKSGEGIRKEPVGRFVGLEK
ncbi:hypothetical protein BC938DRAFT_478974 [Jimgerdemannia flammicorona]|uniref:Protein kinase domain-containing protein n=1 Tax=Jimgerdemannia flammicorona TaxID=994334 RepID=A0A433QLZ0_9FUNG|nr:hypothetical protein BC938DRAFT_478974 [Jimgerdemannia flammicorona]